MTTPPIAHKPGCTRPEPRIYPKAHRCPDCLQSVDLERKAQPERKPHKPYCKEPRLLLFIGARDGDLCQRCRCGGGFVIVANAGTYDIPTAQALISDQLTPTAR